MWLLCCVALLDPHLARSRKLHGQDYGDDYQGDYETNYNHNFFLRIKKEETKETKNGKLEKNNELDKKHP